MWRISVIIIQLGALCLVHVLILTKIGQSIRRTSGSSLTVLPHSPTSVQHPDNTKSNKLSPMSNNSQQSVDMFIKVAGNLSPGRPPPPPYFPPPPPGLVQAGLSPSSVIQNTNGPQKHFNNSPSGIVSSPQNYNSATWERPIHRGGTIASGGSAIHPGHLSGNHHVPHNNSTSSMSKLIVPPPLGMINLICKLGMAKTNLHVRGTNLFKALLSRVSISLGF